DMSEQGRAVYHEAIQGMILMLAPILPHVCHVLWQRLGNEKAIYEAQWPSVDQNALKKDSIDLVVQVNGKKRATINLPTKAGKQEIEVAALEGENVKKFIEGKNIAKVIVVPGRLVNIVVK
ncbi:MAG: class I tRNA ligase family protein, partial [Gammaproteobacteria bacterium]|nr:class I tRNA ligase family protein [Gammaproteobacteria bacterium]